MLKEGGLEGLSLRKLADRVGVSRTAPYHHFKDKTDLLCAIAEFGFEHWHTVINDVLAQDYSSSREKFRANIKCYVTEAADNPELYDLMFGRAIWKEKAATESLQKVAYRNFQHQLELTKQWQALGVLPTSEDSLRLTQVTWAAIHGLSRLLIDGVYSDNTAIDKMCDCIVNVLSGSPD